MPLIDSDVWSEQVGFNALLRTSPVAAEAEIEFIRDMVLNIFSEGDELLRTTSWKKHRRARNSRAPNREHRLEELVDMFKLWLTLVQSLGYSDEEVRQAFWRKSMVVRHRHSEEFVLRELDRPAVVVDIDNVICDYTTGFCTWIINRAPLFAKAAQTIMAERRWFGKAADFGMSEAEWQGFKHEFRSRGHKRYLPTMPGAKPFLDRLRDAGYYIVLLTSRPIDRYPNIFTDTLFWLRDNDLTFDWVWWALDKKECLIENQAVKWIRFAVDDDPKYVEQFRHLGIMSYWMASTKYPDLNGYHYPVEERRVVVVKSLDEIPVTPVTNSMRYPDGL